MAEQDFDQTEEATPHKLKEARKKGSVPKSTDFISLAMMAALAAFSYSAGLELLRAAALLEVQVFARVATLQWGVDAVAAWLGGILLSLLAILGPLLMMLVIVAVAANLMQVGPVFSTHALSPDLTRLSPAAGFKRVFSMRTVYESIKSLFKLVALCGLLYLLVGAAVPGLVGLSTVDPKAYPRILLDLGAGILVKLVLVLLVIGLVDLVYTRWEFGKRMRMSKREVKDENKNREGDPRIRSRIRELRKEMLKRSQSMSKVKSADVLVTNPTHLAVALSYDHGKSSAPQVVAKGAGGLAKTMRKLAAKHNIPIVQNKALARSLFREVDYDGFVPEKLYPQVAKIMVWVYAMRRAQRATGRAG